MISSIGGEIAIVHNQLYNATKAGINMFAATLQRELRQSPVNVMLVLLGTVDTDMLEAGKKDPLIAAFAEKIKIKPLTTEYVAREVIASLMKGRQSLVLPRTFSPLLGVRQIPTRVNDMMMKSVRWSGDSQSTMRE
jgi:short-subunit dehydrogenase